MTETLVGPRTNIGSLISRHIIICAVILVVMILCLGLFAHNTRVTEAGANDRPFAQALAVSPKCDPNWLVVTYPNPGPYNTVFSGMAVIGPNDVWAVGSYGPGPSYSLDRTLVEHWNGSEWSIVSSPNQGTDDNFFSGVAAAGPNDVWAVGYYIDSNSFNQTLIGHWNGSAWSVVSSPNPGTAENQLYGVAVAGPNDVWAVGMQRNSGGEYQTLIEHWNGNVWSIVSSPNPGHLQTLYGVAAAGPNNVWAVGYSQGPTSYITLIEHWNGSEWSIVSSPSPGTYDNELNGVAAAGANDVWAVGYYRGSTLIEHWNGSAWSIVSSPNPGTDDNMLNGVAAAGPNDAWAVGYYIDNITGNRQTLIEHWNGNVWSIVSGANPGTSANQFSGVAIAGPGDVWAGGFYQDQSPTTLRPLIERYNPCTGTPTATSTPAPPTATPTACTSGVFSDVPQGSTFYPYITCLSSHEVVGGYSDCTFRPANPVTRGQLSKIVSLAANFTEDHTEQTFQDVPVGSTFHLYVERLASRIIINGYVCGGPNEPCVAPGNKPYFRTANNVTRGQTSKIVAIARGLPAPTPGHQTFQDVPTSSTFWQWIEELSTAGAIGGYNCGGAGEPCVAPGNKPYFRAANNVTRGQSSKIVSNTFFPNCQSQK